MISDVDQSCQLVIKITRPNVPCARAPKAAFVEFIGQRQVGLVAGQLEADDLTEVLAALEIVLDVALDPGAGTPLISTSEYVGLPFEPLLSFRHVLHHTRAIWPWRKRSEQRTTTVRSAPQISLLVR